MSTCSMAAAPFLFTPVESGLGGLTLGLLAFAKLQITGRWAGGFMRECDRPGWGPQVPTEHCLGRQVKGGSFAMLDAQLDPPDNQRPLHTAAGSWASAAR